MQRVAGNARERPLPLSKCSSLILYIYIYNFDGYRGVWVYLSKSVHTGKRVYTHTHTHLRKIAAALGGGGANGGVFACNVGAECNK